MNERFIDNTDGTVTDSLTGLMWVRSPDSVTRTWQQALDYVKSLRLCGYADWRLPNINELERLVNAEQPNLATWLNTQGFSNVQSGFYWLSAYDPHDAWFFYMWYGDVNSSNKSSNCYVWPVRSGQR